MEAQRLPQNEKEIRRLYEQLIDTWNRREAGAYAALFADDGNVVGFDGSVVDGRAAIQEHLAQIFADHITATYIAIVREVRFLTAETALLRAVVGMIPPGQAEINPAANAIQSLVAVRQGGQWQVALFHNTPAQFHGRPELTQALTEELAALLR